MTERPLRFAMIGAGRHASGWIYPSLRFTELELVAVADLDEERARSVGSRFGNPRSYTDYHKMLQDEELDAVGVVGSPELHHQAGLAVLESGRHLFTEKPPAPDLAKARELQAAAAKQGLVSMVGFMKRHANAFVKAKQISTQPEFGRRTMLRLNYSHSAGYPLASHLIYMSVHPLDLARYFMGDVVGGTVIKRDIDGKFVIALLLQHLDGGVSQVTSSDHEPGLQECVELAGESALIHIPNSDLAELRYLPREASNGETKVAMWYPGSTVPDSNSLVLLGYAGELRHFVQVIRDGTRPSGGIDDGVEAMRLVEALTDAPEGPSELNLPD